MKTSDLRNCAGVGRDKLEARLKECADLLDVLIPLGKNEECCGRLDCICAGPFIAIEHFEQFVP